MKTFAAIALLVIVAGIASANHEDYSIAEYIGDDVYRGHCRDDRSPTEMTYATERVAAAFGIQVKACHVDAELWAWADSRYAGVIWYTKSFVDHVRKTSGQDYRAVLELVAAHEIGHLVHHSWGRVRAAQGQTIAEPPQISELPLIGLPRATSCGFLLFDSVACANWHRITWENYINAQIVVVNVVLEQWQHWFEVEQTHLEFDRRSEMFADCIAGFHLAESAAADYMVAHTVLSSVVDVGLGTPHGTHPTAIDRITATYHGVAGVHFEVPDIVDWCEVLLDVDTRS